MKTFYVHLSPGAGIKSMLVGPKGGESFEFQGIDNDDIEVRDEYHSMHELYQHRMALNIALFHAWHELSTQFGVGGLSYDIKVMKSKLHADGTMFEGYFIVMAITPEGQISYHYKLEHWNKFRIPEVERTPVWDGHNSLDVMERLMKL